VIFSWDSQNIEHLAKHDVGPAEAVYVVMHARRPYPQSDGGEKLRVRGPTPAGRWLQVIYVRRDMATIDLSTLSPDDRLNVNDDDKILYVIHARELTESERRAARKKRG
jgi:hypothetical protein